MKALVADPVGGPENLRYVDLPEPQPGKGEALIKIEVIGVNFIDIYFRKGFYPAPEKPVRLGNEAAGTVAAVGKNSRFQVGQRVAYALSRGSYAEYAAVPERLLAVLPESVSFEDGAAIMLQGMTAHYLTHSTFKLERGQTCLVHAAAGGAGLALVQIAKIAGATVIGTVSTDEKAQLAQKHGADHTIVYTQTNFISEVKGLTNGQGVHVVYDSVGSSTFQKSLDCLRPRGMMVTFGQSSGPVAAIEPLLLMQKGSLFLTRPNLAQYISTEEELRWRSSDLFQWIATGQLKTHIYQVYPLSQGAQAQQDLESRHTTGKLLLKP